MKKPTISIIAAVAENNAIGLNNKLLWHIPEDFKRFKKITLGHPVIMGQNTFESLGEPLTDRTNIVLSRDPKFNRRGVIVCHSIEKAIEEASRRDKKEIFFIGGAQVYKQAMPLADKLYITKVKGKFKADAFFPKYRRFGKAKKAGEGKSGEYEYEFWIYKR